MEKNNIGRSYLYNHLEEITDDGLGFIEKGLFNSLKGFFATGINESINIVINELYDENSFTSKSKMIFIHTNIYSKHDKIIDILSNIENKDKYNVSVVYNGLYYTDLNKFFFMFEQEIIRELEKFHNGKFIKFLPENKESNNVNFMALRNGIIQRITKNDLKNEIFFKIDSRAKFDSKILELNKLFSPYYTFSIEEQFRCNKRRYIDIRMVEPIKNIINANIHDKEKVLDLEIYKVKNVEVRSNLMTLDKCNLLKSLISLENDLNNLVLTNTGVSK